MARLEYENEGFGLCPLRGKEVLGGEMVDQGVLIRNGGRAAGAGQHRGTTSTYPTCCESSRIC
jgi:hypothetical protein